MLGQETNKNSGNDVTREGLAVRNSGTSRTDIDKQVELRMSMYGQQNKPQTSNARMGDQPTKPTRRNPIQEAVPELKTVTQYVLVVRQDVPQCQEILRLLATYAQNDQRILVKNVDDVKDKMTFLRGIPTLIDCDNDRIYEGSAVKDLLSTVFIQGNNLQNQQQKMQEQEEMRQEQPWKTQEKPKENDLVGSGNTMTENMAGGVNQQMGYTGGAAEASSNNPSASGSGGSGGSSMSSSLASLYGVSFKSDYAEVQQVTRTFKIRSILTYKTTRRISSIAFPFYTLSIYRNTYKCYDPVV